MSKENFLMILFRQQQSGLSIKDFCENKAYPTSCFHYWKSKYDLSRPYGSGSTSPATEFAPIRVRPAFPASSPGLSGETCNDMTITIEFPMA